MAHETERCWWQNVQRMNGETWSSFVARWRCRSAAAAASSAEKPQRRRATSCRMISARGLSMLHELL
jgi:hypothetical protein